MLSTNLACVILKRKFRLKYGISPYLTDVTLYEVPMGLEDLSETQENEHPKCTGTKAIL